MGAYGGPCRFRLLENFLCAPKISIFERAYRKIAKEHSPFPDSRVWYHTSQRHSLAPGLEDFKNY